MKRLLPRHVVHGALLRTAVDHEHFHHLQEPKQRRPVQRDPSNVTAGRACGSERQKSSQGVSRSFWRGPQPFF